MIFLVLILGFLLRLVNLNQSLWLDEAITAVAIKNYSLVGLVTKFSPGDFHPPLYYLFLKIWTGIFGYGEITLRLPSVIFGVGTVIFVYLIGKKLFNKQAGILAALFLAVNPLAVYYSQEARMYSLAAMLVSGAVYFLLEKKWLWFVVFVVLSLYTDYLPALMLPVYIFLSKDRKIILRNLAAAFLLLLPMAPLFFNQLGNGLSAAGSVWGDSLGRTGFKTLALLPVKFIFGRVSVVNKYLYGLAAIGTVAGYFFVMAKNREKKLWFWFLVPLFLAAVISFKVPVFTYFRFLFVLPAFVLLLSKAGRFTAIFIVALSLLSLAYFNLSPGFWREDWRAAAAYINSDRGLVLMPSAAQSAPLEFYDPTLTVQDLNNFYLDSTRPIYLLRYVQEIFDPRDVERATLESAGYKRVNEKSFTGVLIWKYDKVKT